MPAPPYPRWMQAVVLLVRLAMAAVFISAAIPKIQAPDLFAASVHPYELLPAWGVNTVALVLPWLELFVGVLLALGVWWRASAVWMVLLIVVFMGAFLLATVRGLHIACGCFEVGQNAEPTPPWWVLLRDTSFLVGALIAARFGPGLAAPRPGSSPRRSSGTA